MVRSEDRVKDSEEGRMGILWQGMDLGGEASYRDRDLCMGTSRMGEGDVQTEEHRREEERMDAEGLQEGDRRYEDADDHQDAGG